MGYLSDFDRATAECRSNQDLDSKGAWSVIVLSVKSGSGSCTIARNSRLAEDVNRETNYKRVRIQDGCCVYMNLTTAQRMLDHHGADPLRIAGARTPPYQQGSQNLHYFRSLSRLRLLLSLLS